MPLPNAAATKLKDNVNSITNTYAMREREEFQLKFEVIKADITEFLKEYLKPLKEKVEYIIDQGVEVDKPWGYGALNIDGFEYITGLKHKDIEFPWTINIKKEIVPTEIRTRYDEITLILKQVEDKNTDAHLLSEEIVKSYGTVKYMLTQFPELGCFFDVDSSFKPNPHYKVRPRSSFTNPDAFITLFANARIMGVTW